jgi:protein-L-isoaspartate O-methyltransferase
MLLLLVFGLVRAADPAAKPPVYEKRKTYDPDGINKFYMGRQIAQVMGYLGAGWLERKEREKEEEPAKLMAALKLKPTDVVADIGAGSGYYTFRMAKQVPQGKVLAVDIQPEMIDLLKKRIQQTKTANVETIQSGDSDPKLKPDSVDVILLVDVYHEFEFPFEMTAALVKALKKGGRIIFVEFRMEDDSVPIKLVHKMSEKQVIKEMGPHPLEHVATIGTLPWQHVIVFRKK